MFRFASLLLAHLLPVACASERTPAPETPKPQPSATPARAHAARAPAASSNLPSEHRADTMHEHRHSSGTHRFENADEWAKRFDDPARDAWQKPERVVEWLRLEPQSVVADIGAGTGYFAMRIARAIPKGTVLANDIEPDMVRYMRERAAREGLSNVVTVHGNADNPLLDRSIDVALVCNTYHHIEDRIMFFAAVRERLGSKGRLVIVDFRKDAPKDAPGPPPALRVAADDVAAELGQLGFRETRRDMTLLPHQYLIELALPASTGAVERDPPGCVKLGGNCATRPCCNSLWAVCGSQSRCVPLE